MHLKQWLMHFVCLSGTLTKEATGSSIDDFIILKAFKIDTHHPKAPKIIEVIWHPLILNRIKCNIDGTALGNPKPDACGGIFRNKNGESIGCFVANLGISNALHDELMGVMLAL